MAGRIMTRMTTDVDQFEVAHRERPALRTGVDRDLRRCRRRPGRAQHRARAVHADGRRSAGRRHRGLPPAGRPASTTCHGSGSRSSTPTSRRACRACARRRPSSTRAKPCGASTGSAATTSSPGSRPSDWSRSTFPFVQFLSGGADAIVLGVGAGLDRQRAPGLRRADRLHPLHRPVLLADPAAVPGLRLLAADAGLGRPDRRPDATRDADPRSGPTRRSRAAARCDRTRTTCASPIRSVVSRPGLDGARPAERRGPADPRTLRRPTHCPPSRPRRCAASICGSIPGRPSRSSARPGPASRPS